MGAKRNHDFYGKKYSEFLKLRAEGKSISEAARLVGVKYITAYMWEKRGRGKTSAERLFLFLRENGPMPEGELKRHFPKLSETFGRAVARGYPITRVETELKKGLKVWYLVEGDERLSDRVEEYRSLIDSARDRIRDII